jgi:hypothetical protein
LMHHPLEFLSGFERQQIRASLVDHVDVILTGHLHEAGIAAIDLWVGQNLCCAAGAVYQTRNWPNTAYYATFGADRVTIVPICYVDKPRESWTLDTTLFPHEAGYQATFPIPSDPNFRGFRIPGAPEPHRARRATQGAVTLMMGALSQTGMAPEPILAAGQQKREKRNRTTRRSKGKSAAKAKTRSSTATA